MFRSLEKFAFLLYFLSGILFFIIFLYALVECYDAFMRWRIKRKILLKPSIGVLEEGAFSYEERGILYRYRFKAGRDPSKKPVVEWISRSQRKNPVKSEVSTFPRLIHSFLYNVTLDTPWVVALLIVTSLLSFRFLLPPSYKETFFGRLIEGVSGLRNVHVEYGEKGTLHIRGVRHTAVDQRAEPFVVTVEPVDWLFFGKPAYVTRERGDPYGSVTYEVYHDAAGNPTFLKEGRRVTGYRTKEGITWKESEGTGIREGKVTGHLSSGSQKGPTLIDTAR